MIYLRNTAGGEHITVSHNSVFNFGAGGAISVEFWARKRNDSVNDIPLWKRATTTGGVGWYVSYTSGLGLRFQANDSVRGQGATLSDIQPDRGLWMHYVVTFDGDKTIQAYINNVATDSTDYSNSVGNLDNSGDLLIARMGFDFTTIAIYDKVLTASEVGGRYNRGSPPEIDTSHANFIAGWDVDERTGDYIYEAANSSPSTTLRGQVSDSSYFSWRSEKLPRFKKPKSKWGW